MRDVSENAHGLIRKQVHVPITRVDERLRDGATVAASDGSIELAFGSAAVGGSDSFIPLPREEAPMPLYLGRFKYSSDAIKAMVSSPQDRSAAAREVAESLGGKLTGFWFAFGEYDGAFLLEAPDNTTAAALAMAVGATGAAQIESTVLLDMDEAQEAMRKAAAATYRPPTA
jgi:uncharacterized protein with GYD domain